MLGTDSMATMVRISSEHCNCSEVNSIFERGRIDRKFNHFSSDFCKLSLVVQCSKNPKLVERVQYGLVVWRVHEIESQQIVNVETL